MDRLTLRPNTRSNTGSPIAPIACSKLTFSFQVHVRPLLRAVLCPTGPHQLRLHQDLGGKNIMGSCWALGASVQIFGLGWEKLKINRLSDELRQNYGFK